jgi:outer membrane lipoprotein-sorting protein
MSQRLTSHHRFLFRIVTSIALTMTLSFAHANDWDMDQLMALLAQNKGGTATFTEKKYLAMLDAPLESSGELLYIAPSRVEKRTLKPKPESLVLDGQTLIMARGSKKRTVQLQDYPQIAAFIESIRGTLAGDRRALEQQYLLQLNGTEEQWTLQLSPKDKRMSDIIKAIRIGVDHGELRNIEIVQAYGDRSVMNVVKSAAP